tara:strand:- start:462 stop:647 length:186 start_codon:yes stop_codon:yes gene_type:complete
MSFKNDEIKSWIEDRLRAVLDEIDYLEAGENTYSNRDTYNRIKELREARNVFRRELEAISK